MNQKDGRTCELLKTQKYAHKISATQSKYFFQKKTFSNSADTLFFISRGGVHKSGDEKLATLYDINLKLWSIMPFWVCHCKRKLDDKIRHQISIKTLKTSQKIFLSHPNGK